MFDTFYICKDLIAKFIKIVAHEMHNYTITFTCILSIFEINGVVDGSKKFSMALIVLDRRQDGYFLPILV